MKSEKEIKERVNNLDKEIRELDKVHEGLRKRCKTMAQLIDEHNMYVSNRLKESTTKEALEWVLKDKD